MNTPMKNPALTSLSFTRRNLADAGLALLGGAGLAFAIASCAPGAVDCELVSCEGAGGSGGGGANISALTVPNCAHNTVAAVETNIIVPKCGQNAACHKGTINPPRLDNGVEPSWKTTRDVLAKTSCKTVKYIDPADQAKSFMLTKVHQTANTAACPDGTTNKNAQGADSVHGPMPMPLAGAFVPLPADEMTCFEEYVKVVAAGM